MVFFGFTIGGALLSHSLRLHIEANSYNSWFNYSLEYSEESNGVVIILELFKIQLYLSILSNCQDFWYNISESYYTKEEHGKEPNDLSQFMDDAIIDDGGD